MVMEPLSSFSFYKGDNFSHPCSLASRSDSPVTPPASQW